MDIESKTKSKATHYGAIDGLRTIAAFGIVMMHMASNNDYMITGFVYEIMIPSFTNFVFLFMTVSAFGMCCGYYEKMLKGTVSLSEFYGKRFKKVLPFFAILVLLDILISPSISAVYEGFANLTLLFGLLPDAGDITVIGVGWFLGLVFVFYLIFPFFCVLIENKRRAWVAFAISIIYNFVCSSYFKVGRQNILYSGCFFLAGGLIYLYRKELSALVRNELGICRWKQGILFTMTLLSVLSYYLLDGNPLACLLVSVLLLIYALNCSNTRTEIELGGGSTGRKRRDSVATRSLLENRVTKFFSGISMEIYLSHMVIFRVLQKLHLNTVLGNGWLQYSILVVAVIAGASMFAVVMKMVIMNFWKKIDSMHGYNI